MKNTLILQGLAGVICRVVFAFGCVAAPLWADDDLAFGARVTGVVQKPNGELHVFYQRSSLIFLTSEPEARLPDSRWKIVYGVKDGKIVELRRVNAEVIPAQEEKVIWPDEQ